MSLCSSPLTTDYYQEVLCAFHVHHDDPIKEQKLLARQVMKKKLIVGEFQLGALQKPRSSGGCKCNVWRMLPSLLLPVASRTVLFLITHMMLRQIFFSNA
jgi:hypothetical protein